MFGTDTSVEVSDLAPRVIEFCEDVITTAVEGGTGYWAQVSFYQYRADGQIRYAVPAAPGSDDESCEEAYTCARLHEDNGEGGYVADGLLLTVWATHRALVKIVRGDDINGLTKEGGARRWIVEAAAAGDSGEIDSDLADVIAQVAVLGEVVYG